MSSSVGECVCSQSLRNAISRCHLSAGCLSCTVSSPVRSRPRCQGGLLTIPTREDASEIRCRACGYIPDASVHGCRRKRRDEAHSPARSLHFPLQGFTLHKASWPSQHPFQAALTADHPQPKKPIAPTHKKHRTHNFILDLYYLFKDYIMQNIMKRRVERLACACYLKTS